MNFECADARAEPVIVSWILKLMVKALTSISCMALYPLMQVCGDLVAFFGNLHCKFACWGEDQNSDLSFWQRF